MATLDIQPLSNGARLTLHDERRSTPSVSEDFDQRAAEQFVRMFCRAAGLSEPWTGR
jgi:hypothetical protein